MPTLEWIGKKAVVNHHREVPFRLLQCDVALSVGDADSGNLLVQGDNLEALKALLPYYAGQVKCIYIDPPYNTGNEGWIYNDNVNGPEIKAWLGKVVGSEAEDLSRHDKWLCMMYPRLALLREFLSEDGSIFVSIDDNEVHRLRSLMDELFGEERFVANVLWQKRTSPDARIHLGAAHDHILVYSKSNKPSFAKLGLTPEQAKNFKNPDDDPRGPWASTDFTAQGWRPNQMYKLKTPAGVEYEPPPGRCWVNVEPEFNRLRAEGRMWFGKDNKARPRVKTFLSEVEGVSSWTWWTNAEVGHNQEAKKEVNAIVEAGNAFDTPKPVRLIRRILDLASDHAALILDSFAGSGTTGHAVLAQNKADGGHRRFILVEVDSRICREVTAERLKRVINGYGDQPALGGGFRYCTLREPLFDETGAIRESVKFPELAAHVFFTETGSPIPKKASGKTPLLGVHGGRGVYLLFNGVLGDKRPQGGNVLTREVLASLPPHDGPKVVYGESCRLGEARLRQEAITFRQVPYDVQVR